jgi:hypothetical protein
MAGDYIKWSHGLERKPKTIAIAVSLKVQPILAAGLCMVFWVWCDTQATIDMADGEDLHLPVPGTAAAIRTMIDGRNVTDRKGFSAVLESVGWLEVRDGLIVVPGFFRQNGQTAKTRAENRDRQRRKRDRERAAHVTGLSRGRHSDSHENVTEPGAQRREEKRREEKTLSLTPDPEPVAQPTERASEKPTAAARFLADRTERTGQAPPGFNAFVAEYPQGRALDRGGLLALWTAQGLESESASILGGLRAWKASEAFRDGFAPKARKFLEERHWESKPPEPKPVAAPRFGGGAF